jgi:hypothetical protein
VAQGWPVCRAKSERSMKPRRLNQDTRADYHRSRGRYSSAGSHSSKISPRTGGRNGFAIPTNCRAWGMESRSRRRRRRINSRAERSQCKSGKSFKGGGSLSRFTEKLMAEKAATPDAANRLLGMISILMEHAIAAGWRDDNPAFGVKRLKHRGEGFVTWSEPDIIAYRGHYPLGTRDPLMTWRQPSRTMSPRRCAVPRASSSTRQV